MNWSDLKPIVAKAAPILGTLVGGPAGAAAGGLIAAALGVDSTPDAVSDALFKNPDAYVKLQEIEANNKVQLQQLSVTAAQNEMAHENEQLSIAAKDRDSARNMAIVTKDNFTKMLAGLVTLGFFGMLALLTFTEIPEANKPILYIMVGSLGTAWATVMAFYFGTTKQSAEHSAVLNNQMAKITDFAVSPGSVTTPDATTTVSTSAPVTVQAAGSTDMQNPDQAAVQRVQP